MNAWQNGSLLVAALAMTAGARSNVPSSSEDPQPSLEGEPGTYAWSPASDEEQAALERINPSLERRLRSAVERELADGGYVLTSEDEADLLIAVRPLLPDRDEDQVGGFWSCRQLEKGVKSSTRSGMRWGFVSSYRFSAPTFGYVYPRSRDVNRYWFAPYTLSAYGRYYNPTRPGRSAYSVHYWAARVRGCHAALAPGTLAVELIDPRHGEVVWRGWAERALLDAPSAAEDLDEYVDDVARRALKALPAPSAFR